MEIRPKIFGKTLLMSLLVTALKKDNLHWIDQGEQK